MEVAGRAQYVVSAGQGPGELMFFRGFESWRRQFREDRLKGGTSATLRARMRPERMEIVREPRGPWPVAGRDTIFPHLGAFSQKIRP